MTRRIRIALAAALSAVIVFAPNAEARIIDGSADCAREPVPEPFQPSTLLVQRCAATVRVGVKPVAWISADGYAPGQVFVSVYRAVRPGVPATRGLQRQWRVVNGRLVVVLRQRVYRRVPVRIAVTGPVA